jgi:hypothetical protein
MTLRVEPARKHGPFDPRWLTARAVEGLGQPPEAPPEAITWPALQAWEGEGGAPLPEERPMDRKVRERRAAAAVQRRSQIRLIESTKGRLS